MGEYRIPSPDTGTLALIHAEAAIRAASNLVDAVASRRVLAAWQTRRDWCVEVLGRNPEPSLLTRIVREFAGAHVGPLPLLPAMTAEELYVLDGLLRWESENVLGGGR